MCIYIYTYYVYSVIGNTKIIEKKHGCSWQFWSRLRTLDTSMLTSSCELHHWWNTRVVPFVGPYRFLRGPKHQRSPKKMDPCILMVLKIQVPLKNLDTTSNKDTHGQHLTQPLTWLFVWGRGTYSNISNSPPFGHSPWFARVNKAGQTSLQLWKWCLKQAVR